MGQAEADAGLMTESARRGASGPVAEDDPLRGAFWLLAGCVGLVGVVAATVVTHGAAGPALVLESVVLAAAASRTTAGHALLLVAVAWGLHTGFVVNHYGELTFAVSDVQHLALLIGVGLLAVAGGRIHHHVSAVAATGWTRRERVDLRT